MKRIWHPYTIWEDYINGMWRTLPKSERSDYLAKAIEFTGDAEMYGLYMLDVLEKWPIACEHNLSDVLQNRRAWIGHAACCLAIGCPEDVTREAWGHLTLEQQSKANAKADQAIRLWEDRYEAKNSFIYLKMGKTGVSERNTG